MTFKARKDDIISHQNTVVNVMKQQTFSNIKCSGRKRKTKREAFLDIMEDMIP